MLGHVFVIGGETYLTDLVSKDVVLVRLGCNGHGLCRLASSFSVDGCIHRLVKLMELIAAKSESGTAIDFTEIHHVEISSQRAIS